jgi:serine/threonine protein phosphatase PrpC
MSLPLRVHAATHIGLVHSKNEDSFSVTPTEEGGLLMLVCDGMGGMGRGDEASAIAVRVISEQIETGAGLPPELLRHAIRVADERIRKELCSGHQGHPGSTAVMAYVIDGAAHVAWVGDSRAYLIREHRVLDRTRDHKLVEDLVEAGQITPEDAKRSSLAHVVTRALGGRGPDDPTVKPATLGHPWKLATGDVILICSDGLCDLVNDDELPALIERLPPDRATERLVEIALERGGHDNITCIVARWEGATYREDDISTPVMRSERDHIPDLRGWAPEIPESGLDQPDDGRVTEEIDREELERLARTPLGALRTEGPVATRDPDDTTEDVPLAVPDLMPAPMPELAPEPPLADDRKHGSGGPRPAVPWVAFGAALGALIALAVIAWLAAR